MHFELSETISILTMAGSHAYGMSTPESDIDIRGICVAPMRVRCGIYERFEQTEDGSLIDESLLRIIEQKANRNILPDEDIDCTVYDVAKAIKLIGDCNPNMLEIVFVHDDDVIFMNETGELLRDNQDLFVSLKAKHTYVGYATSQLKRIERHRAYLLGKVPTKPSRSDYGLPDHESVIPKDQRDLINEQIKNKIRSWGADEIDMSQAGRVTLRDNLRSFMCSVLNCEDLELDQKLEDSAAASLGIDESMRRALHAERSYRHALGEYNSYKRWESERNPKRKALEAQHGFDCYLDDTEFLTESGWKTYDKIENDKIGTYNISNHLIEYQNFFERISTPFNGKIAHITTRNSRCSVTLNHRMLVSRCHRKKSNNFNTKYNREDSNWEIKSLQSILDGKYSHYHILNFQQDNCEEYDIDDDKIILMGSYVSEGSIRKRTKDGNPSVLAISQIEGGRMEKWVSLLEGKNNIWKYPYYRKDKDYIENTWFVSNKDLAKQIVAWCGEHSRIKKLPLFTKKFSKRQARLLLDVMVAGDGSNRKHSDVYYTGSKQLADDIQSMCVHCGITTQVWGPYQDNMYQIYIKFDDDGAETINFNKIEIENIENQNIVCFSVPNEVLITRRNGKVAIQGNTKHASHLIRLARTGVELLRTGKINVKRDDAEELLSIRRGAKTFEELKEESEELFAVMNTLYAENPLNLSKKPNFKALQDLYFQIIGI